MATFTAVQTLRLPREPQVAPGALGYFWGPLSPLCMQFHDKEVNLQHSNEPQHIFLSTQLGPAIISAGWDPNHTCCYIFIRPGRVNGWTSPDEGCYKNEDNEPHCRMHTQEQWGQWALDSTCHCKYEQPLPRSSRWLPCRNAGPELPVFQEKQWNLIIFKHWQLIQM